MQERVAPRAPYGPPATALDVIHRARDRGIPEVLVSDALSAIGVPEAVHGRTLAVLRHLDLVDDNGRRTPLFDRLARATTEEYPEVLAEILRAAYAPIFQIVDPAQDDERRIDDAFRQYEPAGQRARMVTLFMGLCREAGIAPAGESGSAARRPQPRATRPRSQQRARPRERQPNSSVALDDSNVDRRPLHQMVDALPSEGWWTPDLRRRWLRALEAAIDYAIDVRESPMLNPRDDEGSVARSVLEQD